MKVELMTFNIHPQNWLDHPRDHFKKRKNTCLEIIQKNDVCCVQGITGANEWIEDGLLEKDKWAALEENRGFVLFRKDRWIVEEQGDFLLVEEEDVNPVNDWDAIRKDSRAYWFKFLSSENEDITFYMLHVQLDICVHARHNAIKLIKEYVEEFEDDSECENVPIFLAGNFNFEPFSTSYKLLLSDTNTEAVTLVDPRDKSDYVKFPTYTGFLNSNEDYDLQEYKYSAPLSVTSTDYIFVDSKNFQFFKGLQVIQDTVEETGNFPSTHRPLKMTFDIPPMSPGSPKDFPSE